MSLCTTTIEGEKCSCNFRHSNFTRLLDGPLFEHLRKDNIIKDFYARWSIEQNCDSVTLESSHPVRPPANTVFASMLGEQFIYTHECNDNEIAYFKVDVNLIAGLDCSYLGLVFENYALNF